MCPVDTTSKRLTDGPDFLIAGEASRRIFRMDLRGERVGDAVWLLIGGVILMISVSYRLRVVGWSTYDADDDDEVNDLFVPDSEREFLVGDGTYLVSSNDPSGLNSERVVTGTGDCGGAWVSSSSSP